MSKPVKLHFNAQPSLLKAYGRAILARRPALVPANQIVPEIKASINGQTARPEHLSAYRKNCGFIANGQLPLTYPHILASRLHMAMLTSEAFPVRLLGIIHVSNKIELIRPIDERESLDIYCFLSGHKETERGQEFDMITDAYIAGQKVWAEISTFLARRRGAEKNRPARLVDKTNEVNAAIAVQKTELNANLKTTRHYAMLSGDFNPIHLTRLTARLLGFARPIAHGMWSLARTAAEIAPPNGSEFTFSVNFKLPILLPARLSLEHWQIGDGIEFVLKDQRGEKPHLTGNLILSKRLK